METPAPTTQPTVPEANNPLLSAHEGIGYETGREAVAGESSNECCCMLCCFPTFCDCIECANCLCSDGPCVILWNDWIMYEFMEILI